MTAVTLRVITAFLVGGQLVRPGELVEVGMSEAKDLLARGKAEVAAHDVTLIDEGNIPDEPAPKRKNRGR